MHRSVVVLAQSSKDAAKFVEAIAPTVEEGTHVVRVRNKYFQATVHVFGASFGDWFTRIDPTQVSGVISVVRGSHDVVDSVPRIATPWLAFDVVVGVACQTTPRSFLDDWREACVRRGQEWIDPGAGNGFESASESSATAGLLGGDLTGPDRVLQLLHQTPWIHGCEARNPVLDSADSPNWLVVVGTEKGFADSQMAKHFTVDSSGRRLTLTTKYYKAIINVCFIEAAKFTNEMADLLNAQITALRPRALLWLHRSSDPDASQAVRSLQLNAIQQALDNGTLESALCAFFDAAPDVLTDQVLFRLGVETVVVSSDDETASSNGSDANATTQNAERFKEEGAMGWERVVEALECCRWVEAAPTPRATPVAPAAPEAAGLSTTASEEPTTAAAVTAPPVLVTAVAGFYGVGVPLEDVQRFAAAALARFTTKTSSRAAVEGQTYKVTSKYTSATVTCRTAELTDDAAATKQCRSPQVVVVLAPRTAPVSLISAAFNATLPAPPPPSESDDDKSTDAEDVVDPLAGDERVRLLVLTDQVSTTEDAPDHASEESDGDDGGIRLLDGVHADYRYTVEVCDEGPQAALERVTEAIEQCRWIGATALPPPAALVYGCEPPPGFRKGPDGRTVRCSDADEAADDDDEGELKKRKAQKGGRSQNDEALFQLASQMRALRNETALPDDVRKDRAEGLALRFADLLEDA